MVDSTLTEVDTMLIVLGLIDVVLIMVIIGGYETFVSRLNLEGHPDEPGRQPGALKGTRTNRGVPT
jgi:uncharacterized membrane protein YqhA